MLTCHPHLSAGHLGLLMSSLSSFPRHRVGPKSSHRAACRFSWGPGAAMSVLSLAPW